MPKGPVPNKGGVDLKSECYPALIMFENSAHFFQKLCIAVASYQGRCLKQIKVFYFISRSLGIILWHTLNM